MKCPGLYGVQLLPDASFGQTLSSKPAELRYLRASPGRLRPAAAFARTCQSPQNLKETPMSKLLTALLFAAGAIALPAHAASHAAAAPAMKAASAPMKKDDMMKKDAKPAAMAASGASAPMKKDDMMKKDDKKK